MIKQDAVSDLIDREQALKALRGAEAITYAFGYHNVYEAIRRVPSAEQKKGRWVSVTNGRGGNECSVCHSYAPSYKNGDEHISAYCPNCGAKMEVEE